MKAYRFAASFTALLTVLAAAPARGFAEGAGPYVQALGSYLNANPGLHGVEGGLALIFHPLSGRGVFVAPRVGFSWATGAPTTRWDLNTGIETGVWLVNAFALGVGADVAQPSYDRASGGSLHFRVEPFIGVRVKRLGREGALGVRIGAPWDTRYQWSFRAGLTLQFAGVPVAWKYWE